LVDYVWIGGNGELRSKTRVVYRNIMEIEDVEEWNYDGSSTDQADGSASEIYIRPRRMFRCPFRRQKGVIVMCDTYNSDGSPAKYNNRFATNKIFQKYLDQKPWYGLEQEYFIYDCKTNLPLGFDPHGKQGQYYCSVGGNNIFGRELVEEHLAACLYAGIQLSGINAEVAPGQFEFQVGPVEGIDVADQLWIARYILEKLSEKYGTYIVYHPKPLGNTDWNGSGCHTNFSTEATRNKGGYEVIVQMMGKLEMKHAEHMEIYGTHNNLRMTGHHETSSHDKFTFGIADRKASARIPNDTVRNGRGYFEDRRPAANCDPYLVTSKILETVMTE